MEITEEKKESIELKGWAGFATEEKLEQLKLSSLDPHSHFFKVL